MPSYFLLNRLAPPNIPIFPNFLLVWENNAYTRGCTRSVPRLMKNTGDQFLVLSLYTFVHAISIFYGRREDSKLFMLLSMSEGS